MTELKTKKSLIIPFTVLAVLLLALVGAKPMYNLYRDVSFYWEERSEAEQEIKAFAEEQGISYGEYPYEIIALYEHNAET